MGDAVHAHNVLQDQLEGFETTSGSAGYFDSSGPSGPRIHVAFKNPLHAFDSDVHTPQQVTAASPPPPAPVVQHAHGHKPGETSPENSKLVVSTKLRKENEALKSQLRQATGIIQRAQRALSKSEGLVICSAVMRDICIEASLIIADRDADRAYARVVAAAGLDDVFRSWSTEVDAREHLAWASEMDEWHDQVDVHVRGVVEEACYHIVADVVNEAVLTSQLYRTAADLKSTTVELQALTHKASATSRLLDMTKVRLLESRMQSIVEEIFVNAVDISEHTAAQRAREKVWAAERAALEGVVKDREATVAARDGRIKELEEQNRKLTFDVDVLVQEAVAREHERIRKAQIVRDRVVSSIGSWVRGWVDDAVMVVEAPRLEVHARAQRQEEDDELVHLVEEGMTDKLSGWGAATSVVDSTIHAAFILAEYKSDNPFITRRIVQSILDDFLVVVLENCVATDPYLFAQDVLLDIIGSASLVGCH